MKVNLKELISRFKADSESVYNTWFIGNELRINAFPSIRCGVVNTIKSIKNETFGNDFIGSPLEGILTCITVQNKYLKAQLIHSIGSLS